MLKNRIRYKDGMTCPAGRDKKIMPAHAIRLDKDLIEFRKCYTQPEECFSRVGEPHVNGEYIQLEITILILGGGPFSGVTFSYQAQFPKQYPY